MKQDHPIFKFFSQYIVEHCGITYNEFNAYALDNRISELVKILGFSTTEEVYEAYRKYITKDMHDLLIDIATNNETSFFRDTYPFKTLFDDIIPKLMVQNQAHRRISIWSSAASTGQEIYSILMGIKQKFPNLNSWNIRYLATDISDRVLDRARKGIYNQLEVQRGLPIAYLQTFFHKLATGDWKISSEISNQVEFRKLNLLTDPFQNAHYDVIFCRNVLIYQERNNKIHIIRKIQDALKQDGYLFLGSGETVYSVTHKLNRMDYSTCSVFKKTAGD